MGSDDGRSAPDYRRWQQDRVSVGARTFLVATKPGVPQHGQSDHSALMLAEGMLPVVGQLVVCMPCGNGLVGAVAAANGATHVYLFDRHSLSVEAAVRTMAANQVAAAGVVPGVGISDMLGPAAADVVAVRVVPDAMTMRQLIFDAANVLRPGGRCFVAGANDEGARAAARLLERVFGNMKVLAQRRGHRLVVAKRPETLPETTAEFGTPYGDEQLFHRVTVERPGHTVELHTRPGVFSWQHLDEGSALLLPELTIAPNDRVLDLGCGAGVLGIAAAVDEPTARITLVDVDSESVRCVNATIGALGLTNAEALVSDVAGAVLDREFDVVVCNPPFHLGKHTELAIPRQFIRDAFQLLRPGGVLLLVANRTLPYEQDIISQFGAVETRHDGRQFKVLAATKPAAVRAPRR